MIIDASAIVAILKNEPEAELFVQTLQSATVRRLSAASFYEAAIIMDSGRSSIASGRFDKFLEAMDIVIEPVTASQGRLARAAYRDFGKGNHAKAKLNFGDCFAYALARETREPLLYKGNDFAHTDIASALKKH